MLRTILFYLYLGLWFVLWVPLILLVLPLGGSFMRRMVAWCAMGVLWLARVVAGIKYQVHYPATSEDGVPIAHNNYTRADGKAIVAAKHMSILEIAVLSKYLPNCFFIIKRELMWIPVYGWAFWRAGMLPVNRAVGATNMQKLAEAVAEKIKQGMILVIFPEGTRVKPGAGVKLRRGLLFIAESLKLPILPVGTDSGLYWPKKGKIKPGTANVWFEPLLPSTASMEEIAEAIGRHSA